MDLSAQDIAARVLPHYVGLDGATVAPLGAGLINQTFLVTRTGARFVLQRLNPIFPAAINGNIEAVTRRLAALGMVTPHLLPTRDGQLAVEDGQGLWRLQTYVDGTSFDVVQSPAQARAAGGLVARFHRALEGFEHPFAGMRAGVHDTPKHMANLKQAVAEGGGTACMPRSRRWPGIFWRQRRTCRPCPACPTACATGISS